MRDKRYLVSMSPHVRDGRTVLSMISAKMLAMAPALLWGLGQFDIKAVVIVAAALGAAVGTEYAVCKISKQRVSIRDGHAALVGLTLAMMMPAGAPWWMALVASVMAILVGKMPFGPLGGSPISPAVVGLLIVALSWPEGVVQFVQPRTAPVELTAADVAPAESPAQAVLVDASDVLDYDLTSLFLGQQVGAIGGISPLLLLLGGLLLIFLRVGRWQGPLGYILGLSLFSGIAHALWPEAHPSTGFYLFTGMSLFGAFFLCTEWGTTPVNPMGLLFYGFVAGLLTWLLRSSGLFYTAVPYAIAISSLATPLFDRFAPVPFGKVVKHA